jgi:hypothetical protein
MTFNPRGMLVFVLFAGALASASMPPWGPVAAAGILVVEGALLLGIAGFGRDNGTDSRT